MTPSGVLVRGGTLPAIMAEEYDRTGRKNDELPFRAFEQGADVGRWLVPEAGFAWRGGLTPLQGDDIGPWLVALPGGWHRYPVLRRNSKVFEAFRRLAENPSDDSIVSFADRWGPLGHDQDLVDDNDRSLVFGESRSTWMESLKDFRILAGLADDIGIVRNPDMFGTSRIAQAQRRLKIERDGGWTRLRLDLAHHGSDEVAIIATPAVEDVELRARIGDAPDTDVAFYYFALKVNAHLRDVSPQILPFVGGRIRQVPTTMIGALYLRLAQGLSPASDSGLPERPCDQCGWPFMPGRKDNRFCSDTCRSTYGYRRRRLSA